ncbi:MAG: hypothetical protein QXE78_01930 [Nitrososphaeria archaeon]|jgi:hypothetical protein
MALPITTPAPGTIESRRDMLTTSGWQFQIEGITFRDVIKVSGIKRSIEVEKWVDAGTNITHHFSLQIKEYISDGSLTFRVDPTTTEMDNLLNLVTGSLFFGLHYNGTLIKFNHGIEVFRINIYEMIFKGDEHPEYTKNESAPYDITIPFSAAFYEIIKS